jgi:hypothetical protein
VEIHSKIGGNLRSSSLGKTAGNSPRALTEWILKKQKWND